MAHVPPTLYRHTFLVALAGAECSMSTLEWEDSDVRSENEDGEGALIRWLEQTYGEDVPIELAGDAVWRVVDPSMLPLGSLVRYFRLKA